MLRYKTIKTTTYLFIILASLFISCSSSVNNSITFRNLASEKVFVNIRGAQIDIPSGETRVLKEIQKGLYEYSTTYVIPAGVSSTSAEGAVSGTIDIRAGTKVLIIYSSAIVGSAYRLFATISSNESIGTGTGTGP